MAADNIPFKLPGQKVTYHATGAVTSKRFLKVSGNRTGGGYAGIGTDLENVYQCAHAGAGEAAIGVSLRDVASTKLGTLITSGIVAVEAGGSITAGNAVMADASAKAVAHTAGNIPLGIALTGATVGQDAEVLLVTGFPGLTALSAGSPQTHLTFSAVAGTANTTLEALPNPTDTPATADALRDDLVATLLPPLRNNLADLSTAVNAILSALETAGVITT